MDNCLAIRRATKADAESLGAPATLWQVRDPPQELFIQGGDRAIGLLRHLPERALAVVGTRSNQERSARLVRSVLSRLAGFDLIIVSGLARGIDTQAHLGALDAGLPTIAILGCGLDLTYPAENGDLRRRILHHGGLVISEFKMSERPRPGYFIQRNRLIAAWSRATWVVEASHRSGALNTASWARKHERDTYATPCFPGDPRQAGNQNLLDFHHALPLWRAESLSSTWLGLEGHLARSGRRHPPQAGVPGRDPEQMELVTEIERMQIEQGGATLDALLNWSAHRGWSPQIFFTTLDRAIDERRVIHAQQSFVSKS